MGDKSHMLNGTELPTDLRYAIRLPAQRWLTDRTYPFFRLREPRQSEDRCVCIVDKLACMQCRQGRKVSLCAVQAG
jgi:hypothetical protein